MSNVRLWDKEWDRPFEIEGRTIDPSGRRILIDGCWIEIEPRVMTVLIVLAQRSGEIVRRQDLIDEVWGGAAGADQSLNNAISLLRRALKDADPGAPLIKTAPKQGYKLCANVQSPKKQNGKQNDCEKKPSPSPLGAALAACLLIAAAVYVPNFSQPASRQTPSSRAPLAASEVEPLSIAVLPFENFSADAEDAYFADGLAEEVLHALSQIDALKVASRTDSFQFRDPDAPLAEIAERLGVANILEGSVRREGDTIRITAQLISVESNAHLWSSTYDRPVKDILEIQQDIAVNIANALAHEITAPKREQLASLPTTDAEAYEQYLIGKHELRKWTPEGNRRAVRHLEKAVKLDPEFADAHLSLGRAYYFAGTHYGWMSPDEAIPRVKASLVHGISSDNLATRAAALSIYGDVLAWRDRDWRGAIAAYERAYELSGSPPLGYGLTNSIVGNHDAAIAIFSKLLEDGAGEAGINNEIGIRSNLAWALFNARRYYEAQREAERVIALDDAHADAYRVLGRAQLLLGKKTDAIDAFSKAAELTAQAPIALSDKAVALAKADRKDEARSILAQLETADAYIDAPLIAQIYANLGDSDSAFEWLQIAMADEARGVIFLKINPFYDPIRDDPRFSKLLRRLNLGV